MLNVMLGSSLYSQCLIKTDSYKLVCAEEVRYADSIPSGTRLYISSKGAYVTSPRSVFNLAAGYGQYFIKVTVSGQKMIVGRQWINRIDSTSSNKALIYIKDINIAFTTAESYGSVVDSAVSCFRKAVASGVATLANGDYGDVVVSNGGLVMTVDKPDLGLHNLATGDFSVTANNTNLSLTNAQQILWQTKNLNNWISRYLQNNNSITLRTNSSTKTSRIFVDTTGANFQFINGSKNASLRIGDSVAIRFNSTGSIGQVLTVTSVDPDGRLVINPKIGGSGSANCEQTLTKTAHGFRKWTPIYWNGSTWARPAYDSIIPTYIVIDSTSANTFKVANCGNYATSLSEGMYWFTGTSPGYSTVPKEIRTALFEVAQGRLILQPFTGFNLASSGVDKNGIYSGSDSLIQFNTYAKMSGTQVYAQGKFPGFPFYSLYDKVSGLFLSSYENSFIHGLGNTYSVVGASPDATYSISRNKIIDNRRSSIFSYPGKINLSVGYDKTWQITIDTSKFEIVRYASGALRSYNLLPASEWPETTANSISQLAWTAGSPSFLRSQHGVATGTTDINGDLTLTLPAAMPDNTYTMLITVEGTTSRLYTVHTKGTSSCKVRFYGATTGSALPTTSVSISYEAKNY